MELKENKKKYFRYFLEEVNEIETIDLLNQIQMMKEIEDLKIKKEMEDNLLILYKEKMTELNKEIDPKQIEIELQDRITSLYSNFIKSKHYHDYEFEEKEIQMNIKTIEDIYNDKLKLFHFKKFASEEFATETIEFLCELKELKEEKNEKKMEKERKRMIKKYLYPNPEKPLNVSEDCLKRVKKENCLDCVEIEVMNIVRDMYTRFKSSLIFEEYISNSKQNTPIQNTKFSIKNIFTNILFKKKKSITLDNNISQSCIRKLSLTNSPMEDSYLSLQEIKKIKNTLYKEEEQEYILKKKFIYDELDINHKLFKYIENDDFDHFEKEFKMNHIKATYSIERYSFLHFSVIFNRYKIVEYLISKGIDVNVLDKQERSPLLLSSSLGFKEICILLIGNGAKINHRDCYGYSALLLALKRHYFYLIDDFILFGADINFKRENGMTPLHESLKDNDQEMLHYLLKYKPKLNIKDQYGQSPLFKAVEKSSLSLFLFFLNTEGVDYNIKDDHGRNFLHHAAKNKRSDIFEYFLNNDSSKYDSLINQKDNHKQSTPLHLAIEYENLKCVQHIIIWLKKLNENFNVKNIQSQTPLQLASLKAEKLYKEHVLNDTVYKIEDIQEKLQETLEIKKFLLKIK